VGPRAEAGPIKLSTHQTTVTAPQSSSSSSSRVRFGQSSGAASLTPGFGRTGAVVGIALALVLLGGLLWAAAGGQTVSAQQPHLVGGSLVLEDHTTPTVIDVATGQATVALNGIGSQVGGAFAEDIEAVPVAGGTMLINTGRLPKDLARAGAFNFLGEDNYVLDPKGSGVVPATGVGVASASGVTGAGGYADGAMAYIVRYGTITSTVSLVDSSTVRAAANRPAGDSNPVAPKGSATLGAVVDQSGAATVSNGDLWILVGSGSTCQVKQLTFSARHSQLSSGTRGRVSYPCRTAAVEAASGVVAVASPGHVNLFAPGIAPTGASFSIRGTRADTQFLPITGAKGTLWFLAGGGPSGWSVFGVTAAGQLIGPSPLHFGLKASRQCSRGGCCTPSTRTPPMPATASPRFGQSSPPLAS
jgi:hypothetical protein